VSRSRIACAFAAVAALASLAGCGPKFEALTVPPPSKTAELDDEERTISVSKGVALAFECSSESQPCVSPSAKTEDAGIASVLPAYVDAVSPAVAGSQGRTAGAKPRSVFVVLGVAEGKTTLSVTTDDGDADFDVEVVP
jgi:predicted small lipoprotein YifL